MAKHELDVIASLGGTTQMPTFENDGGEGNPADQGSQGLDNPPPPTPPEGGEPPKIITPGEIFGEEFKDKQWDDVKTDYTTRVNRQKELEALLEEISNKAPEFADPEVGEYNAWIKNGGAKDYNLFRRIKSVGQETTDIDALILQKIAENPLYIGHEEKLKSEILKGNPIESTEENPMTDQDIAFNKAKLAEQATKAREYLNSLQSKLQVPATVTTTDKAAVVAQRKEAWTAATDPMLSTIKTIPIQRMVKDGEKEKLEKVADYQIPDHLLQAAKEQVLAYFPNHVDANPESIKTAQLNVLRNITFENLPYIIGSAIDAERAKWEEEAAKTYGGGVHLKQPGGGNNGGGPTDIVTGAKQHFK